METEISQDAQEEQGQGPISPLSWFRRFMVCTTSGFHGGFLCPGLLSNKETIEEWFEIQARRSWLVVHNFITHVPWSRDLSAHTLRSCSCLFTWLWPQSQTGFHSPCILWVVVSGTHSPHPQEHFLPTHWSNSHLVGNQQKSPSCSPSNPKISLTLTSTREIHGEFWASR